MTQSVARIASISLDQTIDHFLSTSFAQLDRVVATATLPEPDTRDPDLALRILDPLLEALAGLAIGSVLGAAIAGVRRSFGTSIRTRVDRSVARVVGSIAPPANPPLYLVDPAPHQAFGRELHQRLRGRIAIAPRDGRIVLAAIAREIEDAEPGELRTFERMLALLADDPIVADRYAVQLATGWRCYTAIVTGKPVVGADAMWARWTSRLLGERVVTEPTATQLAAAGFIARIG